MQQIFFAGRSEKRVAPLLEHIGAGFPTIVEYEGEDGIVKKSDYIPMKHFPIEGDPIPEGKAGWLLFLDEATSASPAIQAAAYKLILDRMVGSHHLHKNVAIVAAGNLETDNAIVQPMSTALQSRLVHLELNIDPQEWINWATSKQVDYRITAFINFKPGMLYTFKPDHTDKTYACPRTWIFANRVMSKVDQENPILLPMLAGTLSEGVAREFLTFCKIFNKLPTIPAIMANPKGIAVPDEPSILYALTGSIAHNASDKNIDSLMEFLTRLPMEFQVVCLRDMRNRYPNFSSMPAIQRWIANSAKLLF